MHFELTSLRQDSLTRREGWSVLLLHGDEDDLIPVDDVIAFEKSMRGWGWEIERQMWERWCVTMCLLMHLSCQQRSIADFICVNLILFFLYPTPKKRDDSDIQKMFISKYNITLDACMYFWRMIPLSDHVQLYKTYPVRYLDTLVTFLSK